VVALISCWRMLGSQKFRDASYSCRCPINSVVPPCPRCRKFGEGARAPASSMAPANGSGAHKLFRRFLDFSQFWTAVSRRICELSSASGCPCEKKLKTASKSGNKRQRNACSNYAPLERTVLRTRSVIKKKLETKASSHQG